MKQLRCQKLSCTIGGIYYGAIFYADDNVLFGALARKMQKMIKILLRRVKPINLKFSFIQNDTYNYIQFRKTAGVLVNLFVHYQ